MVGPWRLVIKDPEAREVTMTTLKPWTEYEGFRHFSGQGTYLSEIEMPPDYCRKGLGLRLDLGMVRETAEIRINGRLAGIRRKAALQARITPDVRPGKNAIEVKADESSNQPIAGDAGTGLWRASSKVW